MGLPRFFRRRRRLEDNARELEFYVEAEAQSNRERGMSPEEAYSAARRKLGNPTLIREEVYAMTSMQTAETVLRDLRYAWRIMRNNPVLTLAVVVTLALGIGGNTAAFSVVHALLLEPLQYRDPGRLVQITADYPRRHLQDTTLSEREFNMIVREQKSFADLGTFLFSTEPLILSGHGESKPLKGARVSANFLKILGVRPQLGRGFLSGEGQHGGADVAMLSNELWRQEFGGNPRILGKTVNLNASAYTVIGILPKNFRFPMSGVDVWVTKPSSWSAIPPRTWDIVTSQIGFGRLKTDVSLEQARAEMKVMNGRALRADSGQFVPSIRITPLKEHITSRIRLTLWILFGVVGFVLLITCMNIANLMLVRTASRERELAIRTSLGASSGRLMRQLLTESVLLSVTGGAIGLLLAGLCLAGIGHVTWLDVPGAGRIRLDGIVCAFTLLISAITGILFGLLPSIQVLQRDLTGRLRETGLTAGRAPWHGAGFLLMSARSLMLVLQVAMALILLVGATLLLRSFVRLQSVEPGFQQGGVLTAKVALAPTRYETGLRRMAFADALLQRVRTLPGVRNAAMALSLPSTTWYRTNIQIQGKAWPPDPGNWPVVQMQSVTPGYFETLQIPVERGRSLIESDNKPGAPPVALISDSFARRFWPSYPAGENPVGAHIREGADKTGWVEIVGIAANVREGGLAVEPLPEFYIPWTIHSPQAPYLVVRTGSGTPLGLAAAINRQLAAVDRNEALSEVQSMSDLLDSGLGQRRLTLWVVASFATIAFLLAALGIYGVVAYSVSQRTQEIGIRRAVGAQRSDIFRLVLGRTFVLVASGTVLGIFGAFALARLMTSLLFEVSATDPFSFAYAMLLFLGVAIAAAFFPARRAASVDPMEALRLS